MITFTRSAKWNESVVVLPTMQQWKAMRKRQLEDRTLPPVVVAPKSDIFTLLKARDLTKLLAIGVSKFSALAEVAFFCARSCCADTPTSFEGVGEGVSAEGKAVGEGFCIMLRRSRPRGSAVV
jgi:hypothetical protein